MNKRQKKKSIRKVEYRVKTLNNLRLVTGRKNGKTTILKCIYKSCLDKGYKPFKEVYKYLKKNKLL